MLSVKQINYLKRRLEIFNNTETLYTIDFKKSFLAPYFYGKEIDDYVNWMYKEKLVLPGCYEIEEDFHANYTNDEWYKKLSQKQIIQCLGIIIRQDRFVDGLIGKHIKDGTFGKLISQLSGLS